MFKSRPVSSKTCLYKVLLLGCQSQSRFLCSYVSIDLFSIPFESDEGDLGVKSLFDVRLLVFDRD